MTRTEVTRNRVESRFELHVDGELAGRIDYLNEADGVALTHTIVDDAFKGQGLGKTLVAETLLSLREEGAAVLPVCPYVTGYMERNPADIDLVPEHRRAEFGLEVAAK